MSGTKWKSGGEHYERILSAISSLHRHDPNMTEEDAVRIALGIDQARAEEPYPETKICGMVHDIWKKRDDPSPAPSDEKRPAVAETIELFNKQFYVVADFGGKCCVCSERRGPQFPTSFELAHQSFQDFKNRFMHERIEVGRDKGGNPVYQGRGSVWLHHKDRRQYDQVVYAPGLTLPPQIRNL